MTQEHPAAWYNFSEAEIQAAAEGALRWPDPIKTPQRHSAYAAWILDRLGKMYGLKRFDSVYYMGTFGTHTTDGQFKQANKTRQRFVRDHIYSGNTQPGFEELKQAARDEEHSRRTSVG